MLLPEKLFQSSSKIMLLFPVEVKSISKRKKANLQSITFFFIFTSLHLKTELTFPIFNK